MSGQPKIRMIPAAGSAGMADLTMCRQAWAAMLAAVSCHRK